MLGAVLRNSCRRWWGTHQLLPFALRIQSWWLKRTSLVWPTATWKTLCSIIILFPHSTSATQASWFFFSIFKPFSWHSLCLDVSSKSMLQCCQRRLPRPLCLIEYPHHTSSLTCFLFPHISYRSPKLHHIFLCMNICCLSPSLERDLHNSREIVFVYHLVFWAWSSANPVGAW